MVDIAMMAPRLEEGPVSALGFFLSYDLASGEGLHLFGIDALNDIISTEAGKRLGEELGKPGSTIVAKQDLKDRLEIHFNGGRSAMLAHPIFSDKKRNADAYFSILMANNGKNFIPVGIDVPPGEVASGENKEIITLWTSTIGTIAEKNKGKLGTAEGRKKFVDKIIVLLNDFHAKDFDGPEAKLSIGDMENLQHMTEVLSLIQ